MFALEDIRSGIIAWLILLLIISGLVVIAATKRRNPQSLAFVGGLVLIGVGVLMPGMLIGDFGEMEFQDFALPIAFILIGILAVSSTRKRTIR
jgi:hypothetical protein